MSRERNDLPTEFREIPTTVARLLDLNIPPDEIVESMSQRFKIYVSDCVTAAVREKEYRDGEQATFVGRGGW